MSSKTELRLRIEAGYVYIGDKSARKTETINNALEEYGLKLHDRAVWLRAQPPDEDEYYAKVTWID